MREHEDALRVLQAAKLLDANGEIAEDLSLVHNVIVQNTCCRRAFIRGAFLAAGSISDPEKFYHFEITCASMGKAKQLQGLMASFDIEARIVLRKTLFCSVCKGGKPDRRAASDHGGAGGAYGAGKYPDRKGDAKTA